ncbi:MAG: hypothetical protein KF726_02270 [Anaerolineae bacterium]|nr:hypothetical protein [Anaerolineae bacterium]
MESRFGVLRFISVLYKLFGILVLVLAAFAALASLGLFGINRYGASYSLVGLGFFGAAIQFIGGAIIAAGLYAFGELIELFISTEQNTRTMAILMERLLKQQQNNQPRI